MVDLRPSRLCHLISEVARLFYKLLTVVGGLHFFEFQLHRSKFLCHLAAIDSKMSMEVDEATPKNVLATPGTTGSVTISLHPLVIMNISEHWTRVKSQEGTPQPVIGALIGKQQGRNIEIMNSFELVFDRIEGDIVIDKDYYTTKEQQFKQVFSDLDLIGWYTTGDAVNESDIKVHKQICEIYESPVFLKLNPVGRHTELPVSVYESVIDLVSGEATMLFVELVYTLATEEAERIGLDHMARMSTNESGESSLGML
ncbi:COP9 signalosome complex subunit 6 [Araneus ventricosus]|uniref:COP9 signalosome complex subunit 6 n=1 Tax=Araneus ventricosus TaxID=182803 RepID=A0A4Y2CP42_ARAVE|nr:COP9 signalosome complex subunit 6 [Araneus ventricosus]